MQAMICSPYGDNMIGNWEGYTVEILGITKFGEYNVYIPQLDMYNTIPANELVID